MGNLVLRVGLALSIVFVAIGMTFAAPNSLVRSDAASAAPAASVQPVVAGFQAAPLAADRVAASTQQAATLIALATTVVLLAIFVILFSYRPRPGGVRASHR